MRQVVTSLEGRRVTVVVQSGAFSGGGESLATIFANLLFSDGVVQSLPTFQAGTSSTNFASIEGAGGGSNPSIRAAGAGANVAMDVAGKGSGGVFLVDIIAGGARRILARFFKGADNAANFVVNNADSSLVVAGVEGTETNITFAVTGKGVGGVRLQLPTYASDAAAASAGLPVASLYKNLSGEVSARIGTSARVAMSNAWPKPQAAGVEMVAHRGVSNLTASPENSLDGVRLAARMGYKMVECDAQITSDGTFVVMHDDTIDRTMRLASNYSVPSGVTIAGNTYASLRDNYVLASTDIAMRRTIPLLSDYLLECKRYGIFPIIEIKGAGWSQPNIAAATDMCVKHLGYGNFGFTCFSFEILDYVRTLSAKVPLYYIMTFNTANIAHVASKNGILNVAVAEATKPLIQEAHAAGVKVGGWTATPALFDQYVEMGFDTITSDVVAPRLTDQSLVYSSQCGPNWDDFSTNGTVIPGGQIQLASGQTITWDAGKAPPVDQGAWYATVEFSGILSLAAQNTSTGARTHSLMLGRSYQCRMTGTTTFTLTAGSGGATVKSLAFAIANF